MGGGGGPWPHAPPPKYATGRTEPSILLNKTYSRTGVALVDP